MRRLDPLRSLVWGALATYALTVIAAAVVFVVVPAVRAAITCVVGP